MHGKEAVPSVAQLAKKGFMIYFTSDLHFYHNNVIRYCSRPYETVEQMNEDLVNKWNEVVKPEDTVICVGDFSLALRPVEVYTRRLNGYKILVAGNHDWCHPAHKKARTPEKLLEMQKLYQRHGWDEVHLSMTMEIDGKTVNIAHLPYIEDPNSGEDLRHSRHRLPDEGITLICGHVHEKWTTRRTQNGTLMVNVGVDRHNYYPISIEQLKEIINGA